MTENAQSVAQKITSRDRDSIEDLFRKASVHEGLKVGLHYLINRVFKKDMEEDSDGFVAWAVEISTQVLEDSL